MRNILIIVIYWQAILLPRTSTSRQAESLLSGFGVGYTVLADLGTVARDQSEQEYKALENQEIKKAGLKVTLPRIKILSLLERHGGHLSAEDVYKLLLSDGEEIGLATVYRVLTQFQSAGLVVRHNFESGQSVFELDHGEHHDHLVCVKCGKVEEFVDKTIEKRQQAIAEKHKFTIKDHALVIYGYCDKPECQESD